MHNDTGGRKWRVGFLAATMTGIALLAAACGASSHAPPAGGDPTTYDNALAFARCMRTHGEPGWPDPTRQGNFNESQIDISSPRYMRSSIACAFLRPAKIKILESVAQQSEVRKRLLSFARCMHSHGYSNFLGLNHSKGGRSSSAHPGVDTSAPFFRSAMKACGAVRYPGGWWVSGT